MRLLSTLRSVTVKLQHQSLDIISAYKQISDVQNYFELLRINIDGGFHTLFKEVIELIESYGIHPVFMPRVVGKQVCQSNPPAETQEIYYKRS